MPANRGNGSTSERTIGCLFARGASGSAGFADAFLTRAAERNSLRSECAAGSCRYGIFAASPRTYSCVYQRDYWRVLVLRCIFSVPPEHPHPSGGFVCPRWKRRSLFCAAQRGATNFLLQPPSRTYAYARRRENSETRLTTPKGEAARRGADLAGRDSLRSRREIEHRGCSSK